MKTKYSSAIKIIYEALIVKKISRVGYQILGNGEEKLGEHMFMTGVIAYLMAKIIKREHIELNLNIERILLMSLFHDFHEARTGDIHKLQKLYVTRDERRANSDIFANSEPEIFDVLEEYEDKQSLESQIVYEANIIALIVMLKQLVEKGDIHAQDWLANADRIKLPIARKLVLELIATDSQSWWSDVRNKLHKEYKSSK